MNTNNHENVFTSSTNWKIANGNLTDSISFDSSSSSSSSPSAAVNESDNEIVPKSPLLLLPPSPNTDPCEITITFAQEHELRQVYIRSTARVFEVYYTRKRRNDRDYLCTVRCGVAAIEEIPTARLEDDWVKVKSGEGNALLDLFEATAEINDAESCVSVTLRLLSLYDKGCAVVDEIYVFADPVDESELEKEEASGTGNSNSSVLMAMFMPTILQLARGKDVGKERDRQVNDSSKIVNEIQQEITDHKGASSPVMVDTPARQVDAARVSEAEIKPGTSCNNVETILDQLVNKVSGIESILTRFEEQILRPINSIDARLQVVEKKLEQFGKKSFESELFVGTEIHNSDSVGSDTDKTSETSELDGLAKNTDNPQLASLSIRVLPDLSSKGNSEDYAVVTELDDGNEVISAESEISSDEVGHSFGGGGTEKSPKRSVSINDALASALAGLLSSTSVTDGKHNQALVVTSPEFSNEDDVGMDEKPLTSTHPDESQVTGEEFGSEHSVSDNLILSRKEHNITLFTEDNYSQEIINGVSEKLGDSLGGCDEAETVISVRKDELDKRTVTSSTKTDDDLSHEPGNLDCLQHELENNVTTDCGGSRFINEGEGGMDDDLKSVLGFQATTCSVDFQTPVLDVQFNPEKKGSENKSFFEELLTAESKTIVECNKEAFDDNLVSVEDEELQGPLIDTLSSVEMVHYETNEDHEVMHPQLNSDISTASLI